ncbi:MAG: PAS domain S-box protein [Clostridia bacterium]|nr:PAS domain S-box protein [Clostridia bacterium]
MIERFCHEIVQNLSMACVLGEVSVDETGRADDFTFLFVNHAFERMSGFTQDALIGKKASMVSLNLKNGGLDWIEFLGNVAMSGKMDETESFGTHTGRWYKVRAFSPEKNYFVSMFQDVTEENRNLKILEKQAEEIQELSNDIEMIFNNTQDGMFLVKVENGEFRYLLVNKAFENYLGISPEQAIGKTPVEVLGKERGQRAHCRYQKCVDSLETITFEQIVKTPEGKSFWLSNYTPIIKDGKVKYIVGSKVDVSELRKATGEKARASHWMNAMFHDHSAMMFMLEPLSGKILDVNPAACDFFGYSKEEFLAMNISDINMQSEEENQRLKDASAIKSCRHSVSPNRLKTGEIRMVDAYTCPISYESEDKHFSIMFDVTDRENYKSELYREKEILKITLDSIGDGAVTTDKDGYITGLNLTGQNICGWNQSEAIGRPFSEVFQLINEETGEMMEDPVKSVLKNGRTMGFDNHAILVNKEGHRVPISDSVAPIRDSNNSVYGTVMIFRDVGRERDHLERILYLSFHDALTGLYNRRFIEEEMKRLDVSRQMPIAVIMGDVNGLKITNDVFGHEAGDTLLKKVGEAFKEVCRKEDIAARWGGDEFLFLLPKMSKTEAQRVIDRIKEGLLKRSEGAMRLSVSFGCAVKEKESDNIIHVIQQAEESMYHNKLLEGHNFKNSLVNTLLATLYEKSMETREHSERLRAYCQALGKLFHLKDFDMKNLSLLARIHDIGNVAIDPNVFQKPEALTEEEWAELKKHPEIGYRIALNSLELSRISNDILSHHERWDGTGYPRGIKGEDIPLLCRILAVADAYDAMTDDRVYRKAMSAEEALNELRRNSGTQFDEKVVDLFLEIIGKRN